MAALRKWALIAAVAVLASCASGNGSTVYHDKTMDFASIRVVAVMPFANLSGDREAADRTRDEMINMLLATNAFYVLPTGEVARGIARAGMADPTAPSPDEVKSFCGIVKADAVITGVVNEYGEVRSASVSANAISLNVQMMEAQTGKVVWSASETQGGVTFLERLFGSNASPISIVTKKCINDLLKKLFS